MKKTIHFILLLLLTFIYSSQYAQSDECTGATTLAAAATCTPSSYSVTTTSISVSSIPDPGCIILNNGDVWFSFVATSATASVIIDNVTTTDPNVAYMYYAATLYDGSCASLTETDCWEEVLSSGSSSSLSLSGSGLIIGNTYFVRVIIEDGYDIDDNEIVPAQLAFDICIQAHTPPANDECAAAVSIGSSHDGNNISASESRAPVTCETYTSSDAFDVWYSFTAMESGPGSVSVSQDDIDIVAELFTGSCGSLSSIGCVDEEDAISFTATAGTTYFLRVYGYDGSMGNFTIDIGGAPVPVTLLDFSGKLLNGHTLLEWQTASERSFAHFEVLKSQNGNDFGVIGQVASGQSEEGSTYTYTFADRGPLSGDNYYKLKMIDINGSAAFSRTIRVTREEGQNKTISIYPNPANKNITVLINGGINKNAMIRIIDITGRVVFTINDVQKQQLSIPLDVLDPGVYFVQYNDDYHSETTRLTKIQ